MNCMKILVSGASGFIGSRLVKKFVEKNYSVTGLIHSQNINNQSIEGIRVDLTDPDFSIPNEKFDVVIHLAAVTPMEKDKKKQKKINYDGTINFFNRIKDKTKFLVYISGLGVFGEVDKVIDEKTPLRPHTDYTKIRLDAQNYLETKCKEHSISFTVAYLGEVYGDGGWFLSQIISRLRKGSFKMPKSGNYYRSFVHVDDVVNALISIVENNATNDSFIITDSKPVLFKDFIIFTCDKLGVKHPGNVPTFLAKIVLGGDFVKLLTTPVKTSNAKISKLYDFKYISYKEGVSEVISKINLN